MPFSSTKRCIKKGTFYLEKGHFSPRKKGTFWVLEIFGGHMPPPPLPPGSAALALKSMHVGMNFDQKLPENQLQNKGIILTV